LRIQPSQVDKQSQELRALEKEFLSEKLLFRYDVKGLLKMANSTFSQAIYNSVTSRLRLILEAHETECLRKPDEFRPYGSEQLLSQGDLHLMDQMDNVPFLIYPNKLITGMLILGPQGSGKSRFIIKLCYEFLKIKPAVKITIIDPKNGFCSLPNFRHLDLGRTSLNLKSPANANQNNFIYEFMPILANVCSLIYGLDFLNQATDIAISQLQQYTRQTSEETFLCLRDIYEALLTIKPKNFREIGYHSATKTAFSLVLGKQNLFHCRGGLSLEWLLSENTVINARSLTSEMQCKALIIFLLYWLYQQAKYLPEAKEIQHVIIIDDATRFAGVANQYDAQKRTSPLGHILAVLRSAGICVIFATQLPAQIDPAVLSLSRNMIVAGNLNGEENLRVIQSFMSLNPAQKNAILRFQTREILAFISGSSWPYPVHGWAPFVEDLPPQNIPSEDYSSMIAPWHSLTEIPNKETEQVSALPEAINNEQPTVKSNVGKLVWDCIFYPNDKVTGHIARLDFSVRIYETVKNTAIQEGYLLHSMSGKSVYLIATPKAYDKFSYPCPYERNASIEHSFYVQLAAHILKQDVTFSKVQVETPIGPKGASVDITTIDKSGKMTAYEITISTSNLLSNATKLQDTAYEKIVWLCKDAVTAKAVKSYFNKSSALPEDLTAKFVYIHFSKFSSQIKNRK